ncbi:MAG: hypothetical protein KJ065_18580 [Anaerolineae bacterium]|nr:hypothetical protein [Anaerolineae bacterium]
MTMQRDPENSEVNALATFASLDDAHILEIGSGDGRLTWRYAQRARSTACSSPGLCDELLMRAWFMP